jgi:hypothetical protein
MQQDAFHKGNGKLMQILKQGYLGMNVLSGIYNMAYILPSNF